MKKIILSAVYLFVSILGFAQTNPVKVADFFADFEIKPYNGNVMDTVYNTGSDIILPVFMRFKLKGPYGSGDFTIRPQKSYANVMYEHPNGFDFNTRGAGNELDLNRNEWIPLLGSIYSPYVKVDLLLYKEYLKSGKLKTYYMSSYDAVNNFWEKSLVANYQRNITVVQVPNFIGPNQICAEATYTIERPDAVTLENASGVATLTALGNNQWKITRVGNAVGTIYLRSTSEGKVYNYGIHVGPIFLGQIDGDAALKRGWSNRVYSLFEGGGPYTNYKWTISDNRIAMIPNGTTVKLSVPSSYQVSDPIEGDWITLKCTMDSECGPVSASMQINIMPL